MNKGALVQVFFIVWALVMIAFALLLLVNQGAM
jgi:hypothetical protein